MSSLEFSVLVKKEKRGVRTILFNFFGFSHCELFVCIRLPLWNVRFKLPIPSKRSKCLKYHSALYVVINILEEGFLKGLGRPLKVGQLVNVSQSDWCSPVLFQVFPGIFLPVRGESYVTCKMLKLSCCEQIPTPIATLSWSDTICNIGTRKWCQRRD